MWKGIGSGTYMGFIVVHKLSFIIISVQYNTVQYDSNNSILRVSTIIGDFLWFDGTIIVLYIITTLLTMYYYSVFCFVMAINISVQYNGGLLPDTTLLTQGYYHRGTRSNTM